VDERRCDERRDEDRRPAQDPHQLPPRNAGWGRPLAFRAHARALSSGSLRPRSRDFSAQQGSTFPDTSTPVAPKRLLGARAGAGNTPLHRLESRSQARADQDPPCQAADKVEGTPNAIGAPVTPWPRCKSTPWTRGEPSFVMRTTARRRRDARWDGSVLGSSCWGRHRGHDDSRRLGSAISSLRWAARAAAHLRREHLGRPQDPSRHSQGRADCNRLHQSNVQARAPEKARALLVDRPRARGRGR
jgi:hypothetical protein